MKTLARIKIDRLTFPGQEKPALKNIDFEIRQGDFIAVTGGAASGKSTLLHVITGAIPHFHNAELIGKVAVVESDLREVPLNKMSDRVGYMMQEPNNQIISLNVREEVAFALENLELPNEQIDRSVKDMLEFVGLSGFETRPTLSLSGGQAQRVVLAGVLALNAPLLILDQPTAELDPQGRREIYQRLSYLNKTQALTIVLVMDRSEEVLEAANRILVMKEGEIDGEYLPAEYYREHRKHRKRLLTPGVSRFAQAAADKPEDIIAKLSDVSYWYKNNLPGCETINLEIRRGDFISVVGLNGSGKSTLAKLLIGLLKPAEGEIQLFAQTLTKKNLTALRTHMGFLFQNPDHQIFAGTLAEEAGFSLKLRGVPDESRQQKVLECLDFVGLTEYMDVHPQRLSRGQRQLLALASVLAADPELIIADEPTSGLDENQGYMVMAKLNELAQKGRTVVLITHDLTMVRHYATRLVAMHKQRIYLDIELLELDRHIDELKTIGLDFRTAGLFEEEYDEDARLCKV